MTFQVFQGAKGSTAFDIEAGIFGNDTTVNCADVNGPLVRTGTAEPERSML